jgi:hypothetical protein
MTVAAKASAAAALIIQAKRGDYNDSNETMALAA